MPTLMQKVRGDEGFTITQSKLEASTTTCHGFSNLSLSDGTENFLVSSPHGVRSVLTVSLNGSDLRPILYKDCQVQGRLPLMDLVYCTTGSCE